MGFRKHRRRGGGGGGGGHHHQHHHHGYGTGEPNGLQPGDDVGNRRSFKPVIVPPDDIGNRRDPEEAEWVPEDNVGNRIDAAPTHELSGVLLDLDGKRRRRRPRGVAAPERVGRFFIGGVNPLIATSTPRPFPGKTLEESLGAPPDHQQQQQSRDARPFDDGQQGPMDDDGGGGGGDEMAMDDGRGGGGRRRRRRGGRGREQVDGTAAQEVSERRAQRFFDFEEDDRFDYTLKTPAEQKRKDAEDAVRNVVVEAGRDGTVLARLIEDGTRPKVLVTIDERGPAPHLPPERRSGNAQEPLFVMGNAALMSLNYLVNKIVNRYPDDRIRLAILPAADEKLYMDALVEHQRIRGQAPQPPAARAPAPSQPAPAPERTGVEPQPERAVVEPEPAPVAAVEPPPVAAVAPSLPEPEPAGAADDEPAAAAKPAAARRPRARAASEKETVDERPKRPLRGPKKAPEIERVVVKKPS